MSELPPDWWSSDEWSTPPEVFARIAERWGPFDLDPCCRPETAKAPKYYTAADNGLVLPWAGRVFVNPPYSHIGPWLQKAIQAKADGHTVVVLVPAATDTGWFHDYLLGHADLHFWRGRIRFIGWQGTPIPAPKTPSLLGVYGG